ncbi:MAG TPA: tetratricopeptide repeat protein [Pyrinomonadaceae bacterium]
MFKSLTIAVGLICCALCLAPASAQTVTSYTDDSTNNRSADRIVSPEARAEAKRLYKEAVKYGLAGLYSQAIEIFQRSIKLDPANADAHYGLGHAYFDLRQYEKAVESLERAVEINPRDQEARDRLSLARTMAHGGSAAQPSASRSESSSPVVGVQVSMNVSPAPPPQPVKTEKAEPVKTEKIEKPSEEVNAAAANESALTKIYRVGPNDVLDIRINDSASQQSTLFTITPAGFLEHPMLAEPLHAAGLTVDEISARIESDLKRRALIDNPKVSVGVRDYASHTVLVSGLVKDSGTKILRREAIPLYVVVADAQPLPEAARATVLRNESNETFEVDLAQSSEMNLLVRTGDVITLLPNVTQFVYIGGEVKQPGEKTFRRGLTLTQAIISAGGVTGKPKEARLGRDDGNGFLAVTRYKLKDIESGKVPDPVVKPGDRIMIVE